MLAPRRVPPCLMVSVATSKMFMNEMGPEATPLVDSTGSFCGPDAGEGEAGAAAGLVDQGGVLDGFEDGVDVVLHGQHETGGELAQLPAGVHQGGGVGHEA